MYNIEQIVFSAGREEYFSYQYLNFQLLLFSQSNEVPNSHHMEKAGLERSIEFFRHHNIPIKTIITDGHKMIAKWIREQMPETTHHLDVWHVAKG